MAVNYYAKMIEGGVYHIYNRSVSGVRLFESAEDYEAFLIKFDRYIGQFADTYAYCLIPNHFHFLLRIKSIPEIDFSKFKETKTKVFSEFANGQKSLNSLLEDQFRRLFSSIALSTNFKYSRRGSLFDGRMKRISIQTDDKIAYIFCYIHHNLIHHKLTTSYVDWMFSSYSKYISCDRIGHVNRDLLSFLNITVELDFQKEFKNMHDQFKVDHKNKLNIE